MNENGTVRRTASGPRGTARRTPYRIVEGPLSREFLGDGVSVVYYISTTQRPFDCQPLEQTTAVTRVGENPHVRVIYPSQQVHVIGRRTFADRFLKIHSGHQLLQIDSLISTVLAQMMSHIPPQNTQYHISQNHFTLYEYFYCRMKEVCNAQYRACTCDRRAYLYALATWA